MALTDALTRHAASTPKAGSKIARVLGEVDDRDRVALLAALASDMPHRAIARALNDEGWQISEKAVAAWREANGWDSPNG